MLRIAWINITNDWIEFILKNLETDMAFFSFSHLPFPTLDPQPCTRIQEAGISSSKSCYGGGHLSAQQVEGRRRGNGLLTDFGVPSSAAAVATVAAAAAKAHVPQTYQ